MSDDEGRSSDSVAAGQRLSNDYGTIPRSHSFDGLFATAADFVLNSSVLSETPSSDDDLNSATQERLVRIALRTRMEVILMFAILRRKYRNNIFICIYCICLIGMTPLSIYLFLQSPLFLRFYLAQANAIHFGVQVVNIIILYLYIATAFNIRSLFDMLKIHPLIGNVFIALCAGGLFATQCLDQVAVYLNVGHFDQFGIFDPTPSAHSSGGTSPDSLFFLMLLLGTIVALFFAILNGFHFLYYVVEYYRTLNSRTFEIMEGEEV